MEISRIPQGNKRSLPTTTLRKTRQKIAKTDVGINYLKKIGDFGII
jgi:hypothetical protein